MALGPMPWACSTPPADKRKLRETRTARSQRIHRHQLPRNYQFGACALPDFGDAVDNPECGSGGSPGQVAAQRRGHGPLAREHVHEMHMAEAMIELAYVAAGLDHLPHAFLYRMLAKLRFGDLPRWQRRAAAWKTLSICSGLLSVPALDATLAGSTCERHTRAHERAS